MPDSGGLPPFRPPYELAGRCLAIVGLWERPAPAAHGFAPIRVAGRPLGMVVVSDFEHPPEAMPIRYREVIAAQVARRGADVVVLPFDMILDEPLPVDLGREHYALPKRFDPTITVELEGARRTVRATEVDVEALAHGPLLRVCALPVRVVFSLAMRLVTSSVDVLGVASEPARRARIALRPQGIGDGLRVKRGIVGGAGIRSLWSQSWQFTSTWLGPPRALEGS